MSQPRQIVMLWIWEKIGSIQLRRKQANLGGELTLYYNDELGQWVEKGKEHEVEKKKEPPPPPKLATGEAPIVYRMTGPKNASHLYTATPGLPVLTRDTPVKASIIPRGYLQDLSTSVLPNMNSSTHIHPEYEEERNDEKSRESICAENEHTDIIEENQASLLNRYETDTDIKEATLEPTDELADDSNTLNIYSSEGDTNINRKNNPVNYPEADYDHNIFRNQHVDNQDNMFTNDEQNYGYEHHSLCSLHGDINSEYRTYSSNDDEFDFCETPDIYDLVYRDGIPDDIYSRRSGREAGIYGGNCVYLDNNNVEEYVVSSDDINHMNHEESEARYFSRYKDIERMKYTPIYASHYEDEINSDWTEQSCYEYPDEDYEYNWHPKIRGQACVDKLYESDRCGRDEISADYLNSSNKNAMMNNNLRKHKERESGYDGEVNLNNRLQRKQSLNLPDFETTEKLNNYRRNKETGTIEMKSKRRASDSRAYKTYEYRNRTYDPYLYSKKYCFRPIKTSYIPHEGKKILTAEDLSIFLEDRHSRRLNTIVNEIEDAKIIMGYMMKTTIGEYLYNRRQEESAQENLIAGLVTEVSKLLSEMIGLNKQIHQNFGIDVTPMDYIDVQ